MSIRKRNEFLDGGDSDDEELEDQYESEEEQGRGAIGGTANKRRKISSDSDQSDYDDQVEGSAARPEPAIKDARFDFSQFGEEEEGDTHEVKDDEDGERSNHDRIPKVKDAKSSAAKQAEKAQKVVRKSGVLYISRVPPFMKPQTLKHFLEPHASKGLGRIFLTPQDHAAHTKRVKNGGNKKKSFTDGWVEFTSKTEAKIAAETLNGNIIGGKKGNFYHDDMWNMKYLNGFKWHHLTEQIANENAERDARIREEIRRSRKENKAFAEDVERAKMLGGMESKKKAKRERAGGGGVAEDEVQKRSREFKQKKAQAIGAKKEESPATGVTSALRKIF